MNKILFLVSVAILTLGIASESWAETCGYDQWSYADCRSGIQKNSNDEYICGTDCTFTVEGTTLKVKANSNNARISSGIFSPMYYSGGKVIDSANQEINFNKVELDGDFAHIGDYAFANSGARITSTSGVLNVKDIGAKVFAVNASSNTILDADVYISSNAAADTLTFQNAKIYGDFVIADGVTTIARWFMGGAKINGNVIIPDSITEIRFYNWFTLLDTFDEGHKVYCGVENCYDLFYNSCDSISADVYPADRNKCFNLLSQLDQNNQLSAYPDGCSKLGVGVRCQKCKNNNFNLNDGECDRIRWTPAEVAKVLHDDNTNVVTITFKHK